MITDEVIVNIEAGRGGDGSASFRREKYVPKGGPDGGDGGKGGDIFVKANPAVHTLSFFTGHKLFKAENGQPGRSNQKTGKSGEDLILEVPPGVIIFDVESNDLIADLVEKGQQVRLARGGRGGWGNVHFKTATNRTPREFNEGQLGEKLTIKLELKLIADVGLVGYPNVGKSTLISHISNATPKIADYPFTTLQPNLGMVQFDKYQFVVADIPGLIEGAAQGKGLGHDFLKHIERTKLLAHVLDATSENPLADYKIVRRELKDYNVDLEKKSEIIVLNKIDTLTGDDRNKLITKLKKELKAIFPISAVSGEGISELIKEIVKLLKD